MRKYAFLFVAVTTLGLLVGCANKLKNPSTEYPSENVDTVVANLPNTELKTTPSIAQTAIGNIHMNIDESQFEAEKDMFLSEHNKLGGLTIKSLKGYFYDNRLAAIEIISNQQDLHRKKLNNEIYDEGWGSMYASKYEHADMIDRLSLFSLERLTSGLSLFKKNDYLIEVSDFCVSPQGHRNYEDIINNPIKQCYGHNLLPLKYNDSNNLERASSVYSLINELPKERAKKISNQYNLEKKSINTDNLVVKISAEAAIDLKYFNLLLPEVKAQRDKLLNMHKDDPSWSYIIIYYLPLLEKYNQEKERKKERKKQARDKELDII